MNKLKERKIASFIFFWSRPANFGYLRLNRDSRINFQNPGMGSMITKDQKIWITGEPQ